PHRSLLVRWWCRRTDTAPLSAGRQGRHRWCMLLAARVFSGSRRAALRNANRDQQSQLWVEGRPMTRAEKAERISKILGELYPAPAVPLPHEDPYTLLLAVVLSAQCTDVRVNEIAPLLFARARTPAAMAALRARDIERIIRPCGLAPAKARHIRA